ncbi:MAG: AraC family transcriptional regulator [Kiritimatiellae bacterium]|nr:AraC family transcriptional regulator [Kiritimatiellia bacterium]
MHAQRRSRLPAGILSLGRMIRRDAAPTQRDHRHAHALELLYLHKGGQRITLEGQAYPVPRGSVFVSKPGELHGGVRNIIQPGELYWLVVDLAYCRRRFGPEFTAVAATLNGIQRRDFLVDAAVRGLFEQALDARDDPGPFAAALLESTVETLLIHVARGYQRRLEKEDRRAAAEHLRIRRAVEWADAHVRENWSVAEAAAVCGLKPSRFHELCVRATGYPPVERRNRRRVELAREMIAKGTPVTQAAFAVGFCSSQYFATVFRKYEGLPPTSARARRAITEDGIRR